MLSVVIGLYTEAPLKGENILQDDDILENVLPFSRTLFKLPVYVFIYISRCSKTIAYIYMDDEHLLNFMLCVLSVQQLHGLLWAQHVGCFS